MARRLTRPCWARLEQAGAVFAVSMFALRVGLDGTARRRAVMRALHAGADARKCKAVGGGAPSAAHTWCFNSVNSDDILFTGQA